MTLATLQTAATAAVLILLPALAGAAEDDPVVARVDGAPILRSELVAAQRRLPEQYRNVPLDSIFKPLLSQLIDARLMAAKARADGIQDSAAFKAEMALLEEQLLQRAYLDRAADAAVTPAALRARYDAVARAAQPDPQVRARHILVQTEEEARAVIVELGRGADFARLAAERSVGPSKDRGGDLGFFGREQMVKPFADAAFALQAGQTTTAPVRTEFGWHVIRVEERRVAPVPSFEDSRAEIAADLREQAMVRAVEAARDGARVETYNIDGSAPAPEIRPVP